MLTFRRALAAAVVVFAIILLVRSTHNTPIAHVVRSPKPTGTYYEQRAILDGPPQDVEAPAFNLAPQVWNDDNTRIAVPRKNLDQIPLGGLTAQPLRTQLEYAFPYDPLAKFPAFIWQTWQNSPSTNNLDEEFKPFEASWSELHPNFVHEVVTDDAAVHLIRHFYAGLPEVVEAYESLPAPVFKADFFRYLILLARGGIYSDIDTQALKSAVDWVPQAVPRSSYGLVIGIEADPDRDDWKEWYSRRIQFCQWTIQAKPGHPILVDIVATITQETLRMKRAGKLTADLMDNVVEITGPAVWTDAVFRFFNNPEYFEMSATVDTTITWKQFSGITAAKKVGDVIVLPITSFSPGVGQMGAGEPDDAMAFVQHNFMGSWKPEELRHIGEAPPEEA